MQLKFSLELSSLVASLLFAPSFVSSSGRTNCERFRVEKICNLPKDFLHVIDTNFYKKFVLANGVPIMSSGDPPDFSLVDSARIVTGIMERLKPEIVEALLRRQQRIIMYGPNENSCSLPEQAGPSCKPSMGLGLSYSNIVSIPYLREKCEDAGHGPYAFLIHEFGHAVNSVFHEIDKRLQLSLNAAYDNAKTKKIWPLDSYGMINVAEYFPLCWTPTWYKINHKCQHDPSYCSRDKCALRDPLLYKLVQNLLENPAGNFLNLDCSLQCENKTVRALSMFDPCLNESMFYTLKLQHVETGRFLDSNINGESYTLPVNGGFYQTWKITRPRINGTVLQILNIATGLALEASDNGKVFTSVWNKENKNQAWVFMEDKSVQNVGTARILYSNGNGRVYTEPLPVSKTNRTAQEWNTI